jgi:hypothetical protein
MSSVSKFVGAASVAVAGLLATGAPATLGAGAVHAGAASFRAMEVARAPHARNAPIYTDQWAGHFALAPSGTSYTVITAKLTIPKGLKESNEKDPSEVVGGWIGLQNGTTEGLIQCGWGYEGVPIGPPYPYLWWEDYPNGQMPIPAGKVDAIPGDTIQFTVQYLGSDKSDFTFYNTNTKQKWSTGAVSTPYIGLSQAWFAVENPLAGSAAVPNFGSTLFQAAYYGPSTSKEYPLTGGPPSGNSGNVEVIMNSVPGASPTPVSNAEFTVNYEAN